MTYTKQTWTDGSGGGTPLSAARLGHMEDGIESANVQSINAQTGTSYTLAITDSGKLVTLGNAAAITLTVPKNSVIAFPVGTRVDLLQILAGIVTVAPVDGDVTVNKPAGSTLVFEDQGSAATLIKTGTDAWWIVGRLADA